MLYYIVQIVDNSRHVVAWRMQFYSLECAKKVGVILARFFSEVPFAAVELLSFDAYGQLVDFECLGVE